MEILELELPMGYSFYCPFTSECIIDRGEALYTEVLSLQAYWLEDREFEKPFIKNEQLKKDYEQFLSDYNNSEECADREDLEKFMRSYYNGMNWVVFCITSGQGTRSNTVWFVIDIEAQECTDDED